MLSASPLCLFLSSLFPAALLPTPHTAVSFPLLHSSAGSSGWCDRSLHPARQLHPVHPPPRRASARTRPTFTVPVALLERDVIASPSSLFQSSRFPCPRYSRFFSRVSHFACIACTSCKTCLTLAFACPRLGLLSSPLSLSLSFPFVFDKIPSVIELRS